MDSSAQTVATQLGTSRTRVIRAARRLGIGRRTPGGHWRFSPAEAERLRERLGRRTVDASTQYSPTELRTLAALQRPPRGALSARTVARRAVMSPTSASRALARLRTAGLVCRTLATVAEGVARRVAVWHLNYCSPRWAALAPVLASIEAPNPRPTRASRVPRRLAHLFWNVDLQDIEVERDAAFIARRVIVSDDLDALAWAARHLSPQAWETVSRQRGLDPRRRSLARNLSAYGRAA